MKTLTYSFLLLLFLACNKKEDCPAQKMPIKGDFNFVACKVNGEIWRTAPKHWYDVAIDAQYSNGTLCTKCLSIFAKRQIENSCDTIDDIMVINLNNLSKGKVKKMPLISFTEWKGNFGKNFDFRYDSTKQYVFEITELDTLKRTLKAKFEGFMYSPNRIDTLKITEGQIGINY